VLQQCHITEKTGNARQKAWFDHTSGIPFQQILLFLRKARKFMLFLLNFFIIFAPLKNQKGENDITERDKQATDIWNCKSS
jgi:hypothetical protein